MRFMLDLFLFIVGFAAMFVALVVGVIYFTLGIVLYTKTDRDLQAIGKVIL